MLFPTNTIPVCEDGKLRKIRIEEAQIEEGKCIQVELISDKKLKIDGKEGDPLRFWRTRQHLQKRYTTAGKNRAWYHDRQESWKKAPSGSYADTVAFQISYVDATD
ncbi:MAG: hypothetical protein ACLTAF_02580 [Blautia coccoides]